MRFWVVESCKLKMRMFRFTLIPGDLKAIMEGIRPPQLTEIAGHLNMINFGHMMDLLYYILLVMMAILD